MLTELNKFEASINKTTFLHRSSEIEYIRA